MLGGTIVETGGVELAAELHTDGYDRIRASHPDAEAVNQEMVKGGGGGGGGNNNTYIVPRLALLVGRLEIVVDVLESG